ncbi:MAG: class B sortase, partial [Ruminococcus sp.]|uniref:class B sortase n=1 Tax=Ruminococcus sp. TaxID=41978 RepID=UPI003458FC3C|nr:class B sortase [Ruminococcus sp.]
VSTERCRRALSFSTVKSWLLVNSFTCSVPRSSMISRSEENNHKKKKKKKKKTFAQKLRGLFPGKGDSVLECVRKIVFLGSVAAIFVCGYLVGDYYYELWASKHKTENIMEIYDIYDGREATTVAVEDEGETRIRFEGMLDGARKLWDQNHDIVGVINIPDTPVNNPVMQADDNDKYMRRKFDLSENRAGEIFLDYRNHFDEVGEDGYLKCPNSGNLVIYGHNMLDEQMFGSLKWYQRNEDYYGKHPIIYLSSNYRKYTYKIFAYFILDIGDETDTKFECWNELEFSDENEFYGFVNEAKRRSLRLNDVDVKYGDPLITLSTCNTTLPDEDAGRLIIMARLVRDGEDPMAGTQNSKPNPNIKWPTSYYQTHPNERYDPNAEFVPYG